ncbi:MAG: c-type cytochrome [Acidobacteriota bacterium]
MIKTITHRLLDCGIAGTGLAVLILATSPANAQIPDEFKNLRVLDKNISKGQLMATMRSFAIGLGVRCQYCHVGEEGKPLSTFDFPSDEKAAKKKARIMIQMVRAINGTHLPKIAPESDSLVKVRCVTCHRGITEPRMLQDVLAGVYAKKGIEATLAKYNELKERYYGGFTYDFGEGVLNEFAMQLASREKKVDDALRLLRLNESNFPRSAMTHYLLGEAYLLKQDREQARKHFEKSLDINPDNRRAKARLRQLSKQ